MKSIIICFILILPFLITVLSSNITAQTPTPTPTPTVTTKPADNNQKSSTSTDSNKPENPKVLVPKKLKMGDTEISGDAEVKLDEEKINKIYAQIQDTIKQIQTQAGWDKIIEKLNNDIKNVKKYNGWGDDVEYDFKTDTWIQTPKTENKTPTEVKK